MTASNAAVSAEELVTATLSGGEPNDTITVPVKITAQNYDCTINVVVTLTELADPVFTAPSAKNTDVQRQCAGTCNCGNRHNRRYNAVQH
ncbi:MAG: hypothetical protein J6N15_02210 [Ruminiclostridium sp.]|nr:hypothetical protein [Ruminiclostridium sp.]